MTEGVIYSSCRWSRSRVPELPSSFRGRLVKPGARATVQSLLHDGRGSTVVYTAVPRPRLCPLYNWKFIASRAQNYIPSQKPVQHPRGHLEQLKRYGVRARASGHAVSAESGTGAHLDARRELPPWLFKRTLSLCQCLPKFASAQAAAAQQAMLLGMMGGMVPTPGSVQLAMKPASVQPPRISPCHHTMSSMGKNRVFDMVEPIF